MGKANRRAKSEGKLGKSKAISGVAVFSAFVGSISFGLVVGLVPGALQVAGVTSMAMAHVMLLVACFMAVISLWHMESFKERPKGRVVLVVVVLGFFGWLDFWMLKERAKLDMANVLRGSIRFLKTEIPKGYAAIDVGKQFGVNWYFANPGPGRIFNVLGFHEMLIEEVSEQSDHQVKEHFGSDLTKHLAEEPKGYDLSLGEGMWATMLTPLLTQQQSKGVLEGTTRIYILAWFRWTDAQGNEDTPFYRCVWLQGNSYPSTRQVEDLIWVRCT